MNETRKDAFRCDDTRRGDVYEPFYYTAKEEVRVKYVLDTVLSTVRGEFKRKTCLKHEGGRLVRRVFKRFLLIAHQIERFYQHTSMRSHQKAVPYWKMNDFSRFSGIL